MKRVAAVLAGAALLGAGAADAQRPTQAQLFCHDLKRVVKAAGYEDGFDYLQRSRAAPPWLGFRPGACRAHEATETLPAAWWCHQQLAPEHLSLESLDSNTASCLPQAKRERGRWGGSVTFTLPGARILITQSGGPRAKVGRISGYRVEAVRSR